MSKILPSVSFVINLQENELHTNQRHMRYIVLITAAW